MTHVWKNVTLCNMYKQAHLILLYFTLLHFIDIICLFVCFLKLKVCGNPALSKSISAIFPTFAYFVLPCHGFWQFLQYFKLFYLYLLW